MWNLGTEHFKNLLLPQFMIKISGMLHDSKERFVNKKQKKPQTKTKKQRKHPTYNNKLTKVSV